MSGCLKAAVYPHGAVERMRDNQLRESISFLDPDVLIPTKQYHRGILSQYTGSNVSILTVPSRQPEFHDGSGPLLASIGTTDQLAKLGHVEDEGVTEEDSSPAKFILSDLLSVKIDLTELSTRLEGQSEYESALDEHGLQESYVHLTTNAPPDYRNQWGDLTVQGLVPGADETGVNERSKIALVTLHPNGVVSAREIGISKFGLEALEQVGPSRAQTLRDAGYTTRQDVANTPLHELQTIDGIGKKIAQKIQASATAIEDGEVHRTSDTTPPQHDPVYIDIETDGLSPTIVWLIGVLDSATDRYYAFTTRDPEQKGKAVEDFMMWYTANASDRPIVAYHGLGFDFPVLGEHIERHCPEYSDAWDDAWTFDPYWWAVKNDNAILPGRTNKLEDVANGLGWDSDETGLTGSAVAHVMQRWLSNPCEQTAPDWEKHEAYCEDDVRSMAYLYEELQAAERLSGIRTGSDTTGTSTSEQTAQGTLSDF